MDLCAPQNEITRPLELLYYWLPYVPLFVCFFLMEIMVTVYIADTLKNCSKFLPWKVELRGNRH